MSMDSAAITVLTILIATVVALIFEPVRIDVIALIWMLALGWTGVLTPQETLSGFSSNAVIAMIAVMILGQGIAKTGMPIGFAAILGGTLSMVGSGPLILINDLLRSADLAPYAALYSRLSQGILMKGDFGDLTHCRRKSQFFAELVAWVRS